MFSSISSSQVSQLEVSLLSGMDDLIDLINSRSQETTTTMNETTPPIGVSLHFLQRILEDKRLRRPVHKLGRPTAKIETMKVPPLQSLAKSLRLHSDLPVNEFDLYNDLTIKREALIKHLKLI